MADPTVGPKGIGISTRSKNSPSATLGDLPKILAQISELQKLCIKTHNMVTVLQTTVEELLTENKQTQRATADLMQQNSIGVQEIKSTINDGYVMYQWLLI